MRINVFVAQATGLSRRAADAAIREKKVHVNGRVAAVGQAVDSSDVIQYENKTISLPDAFMTVLLNKPTGYVCSRAGQGARTIYDLLPAKLHSLKPVGRLDKDSSGLLVLTNDGKTAHKLTHPSYKKVKVYDVNLSAPLSQAHKEMISNGGVQLDDGPSTLRLKAVDSKNLQWTVQMHEGRNRQIRRTFIALGYGVIRLHRVQFGDYKIGSLKTGQFEVL